MQKVGSAGAFVTTWGTTGCGDDRFNYLSAVAVDTAGTVFVTAWDTSRVRWFARQEATLIAVSGGSGIPHDPDGDGRYGDVTGNGRADVADVVPYFNRMTRIAANGPIVAFDYNGNGRIDFAEVSRLFILL